MLGAFSSPPWVWEGGLQVQTLCSGTDDKSQPVSYWQEQDDFGQVPSLRASVSPSEYDALRGSAVVRTVTESAEGSPEPGTWSP